MAGLIKSAISRLLNATRYDAAQTTSENARHWLPADSRSANASNTYSDRRTLRNRSRYEAANNSYCRGIVLTLASDCIGSCPRIQLGDRLYTDTENEFSLWADEVRLGEKLRVLRRAKCVDGEAFAILHSNGKLKSRVKLDITPIEADRVTSGAMGTDLDGSDGIDRDRYGNPTFYSVLRTHPGDVFADAGIDKVRSDSIIHWYRMDRPEQLRGVPELTPALPLFAQLRRYTLAVLAAAETAADFAAVLYTDSPAGGESIAASPFEVVSLEKRMATTLPDGWKLGQLKAEQPVTNYPQFKREILGEIGRALQIPVNIVTGDSSQHNYASGRLDYQVYRRAIRIEQEHCASRVLSKIWRAWLGEYSIITGMNIDVQPDWFWDGFEHVDPLKEANAQKVRISSMMTSLTAEYARQGKDWETELRRIARERALMKELGIDFMDGFENESVTRSYSENVSKDVTDE